MSQLDVEEQIERAEVHGNGGGIQIKTAIISLTVAMKQDLLGAVPAGKVRVLKDAVARNPNQSLAAVTSDQGLTFGFNANADDTEVYLQNDLLAGLSAINHYFVLPQVVAGGAGVVGEEGDILGCRLADGNLFPSINVTGAQQATIEVSGAVRSVVEVTGATIAVIDVTGSGTATSDGEYLHVGTANGKKRYVLDDNYIEWDGTVWNIFDSAAGDVTYTSTPVIDDVDTPDLVTTWIVGTGDLPVPSVDVGTPVASAVNGSYVHGGNGAWTNDGKRSWGFYNAELDVNVNVQWSSGNSKWYIYAESGIEFESADDTEYPWEATFTPTLYGDSPAPTVAEGVAVPDDTFNATYRHDGERNGRPSYSSPGSAAFIAWDGSLWCIYNDSIGSPQYTSSDDVATPDLATFTATASGDTPVPTVEDGGLVSSIVVGEYFYSLLSNDRPLYVKEDAQGSWTGSMWILVGLFDNLFFFSTDDVPLITDATNWQIGDAGDMPLPTVTEGTAPTVVVDVFYYDVDA